MGASKATARFIIDQNVWPVISSKASKETIHRTTTGSHNKHTEQRSCFSSTMNIQNFAKYPTKQRGSSTMLATSGWLGISNGIHKLAH